ncbi:hypothetical protein VPR01S_11_00940 [Vibrio proteolyticus NBRC 13287]|uniref:Uncharacterized protein n=1 Tax=Vibrio proteolyticus NBRC 13287 TaxID=1219065 RepID=U2ZK06_VIBPR|nr:hypothetical protein VPR01S_11_00940 [Vibrio proteolyticus NBRC 13287]
MITSGLHREQTSELTLILRSDNGWIANPGQAALSPISSTLLPMSEIFNIPRLRQIIVETHFSKEIAA